MTPLCKSITLSGAHQKNKNVNYRRKTCLVGLIKIQYVSLQQTDFPRAIFTLQKFYLIG